MCKHKRFYLSEFIGDIIEFIVEIVADLID